MENEDDVLVVKRIHVTYHLRLLHRDRETADRVHGFHREHCPVARSIGACVAITTSLSMEDLP